MTIYEARIKISKELKDIYESNEAMNVAELILEKISGHEKTEQIRHKEISLSREQEEQISSILVRLLKNEPVQYILEEAWFAGMRFKVNKNVLIPRPETEELVDWIVKESQKSIVKSQNIIDIGTGSGCIPISIKKKLPKANIHAIDVCSEAIFVATENAIALDADIEFILLDFLNEEKWAALDKYDIIVSNPPYVLNKEKETIHQRVISYEPSLALFVPDDDGLIFYKKLADFSLQHLKPGGKLFVEINESNGNEVLNLFQSKGFTSIELRKDMQGKDRMVMGVLS